MALSFFTICLPVMLYLVITLFGNLLKFIQMLHIEEENAEGSTLFGLLTAKQGKLLFKVAQGLMGYLGLYFLTVQLDLYVIPSEDMDKI